MVLMKKRKKRIKKEELHKMYNKIAVYQNTKK